MVEVFKTNVEEAQEANSIMDLLLQHFPGHKISFDLEDCDKVLRIEGHYFSKKQIVQLMAVKGFACAELE